jgi:signal transduction histidine kinase
VLYMLVLTNPIHNLFFYKFELEKVTYGPFYIINIILLFTYISTGFCILIRKYLKQDDYMKKKIKVLIISAALPVIVSLVETIYSFLFNTENTYLILTSLSLSISMLFYAVAAWKYKFLNIIPNKYIGIIDNMRDCVVVVDCDDKIISYNKSFSNNILTPLGIKKKSSLDDFIKKIYDVMEKPEDIKYIKRIIKSQVDSENKFKLTLCNPKKKSYIVRVKIIYGQNMNIIGRVLDFNEITDYIELVNDLKNKNHQLIEKNKKVTVLNKKLKEYILTAEELAIMKERNRISRDFYTSLGYSLNLQLTYIEVVLIELRKKNEDAKKKLEEAIKITRENMKKIRESLSTIVSDKIFENNLIDNLKKTVDDFKYLGIRINLIVRGEPLIDYGDYCMHIYKVCQEVLSNSLRHGNAKIIDIFVVFENTFKITIKDNGKGCTKIEKQKGLNDVEERIRELQGKINYKYCKYKGFGVYIEVPRKNIKNASNNSIAEYINVV